MPFITVDIFKSLVTEDMIKDLISDNVIEKVFLDERVKSHIKKLVKEVALGQCEKGLLVKDKVNGRRSRT